MVPKARKKLEALVWKHTHRDFKGKQGDGTKTILHLVPGAGTCVVSLSSLTNAELLEKLPRSVREVLEGATGRTLSLASGPG